MNVLYRAYAALLFVSLPCLCTPLSPSPSPTLPPAVMGALRSRSLRTSPEAHPGPAPLYHSDSIDADNEVLRARAREEPSVVLVGDACMTALCTLDLRTLSPDWDRGVSQALDSGSESGSGSECRSDLEEHIVVTFSGGEDSLVSDRPVVRCHSVRPSHIISYHVMSCRILTYVSCDLQSPFMELEVTVMLQS